MSTPWTEAYGGDGAGVGYRLSGSITTTVSEIVELEEEQGGNNSSELFEINHREVADIMPSIKEEEDHSSLFSFDVNINNGTVAAEEDDEDSSVDVAVGKSESSMDALSWALSHFVYGASTAATL